MLLIRILNVSALIAASFLLFTGSTQCVAFSSWAPCERFGTVIIGLLLTLCALLFVMILRRKDRVFKTELLLNAAIAVALGLASYRSAQVSIMSMPEAGTTLEFISAAEQVGTTIIAYGVAMMVAALTFLIIAFRRVLDKSFPS